jgi:SagB-type dehydrogenase family enzyme
MTWREYHEATKHSPESLRRLQHVLDWANMPDPFRHYEGVPVLDFPADPDPPEIPALELLQGAYGAAASSAGPEFLSQLLFHSAAISASKRVPSTGYRYALRVNPSSGNLHPTEFHFLARGLKEWPDGLYHYRPSSHMAEQRATGDLELETGGDFAPIVFVLTTIAWREAWKYRDRAYRYCLHDIGHAWQALALAARAMGCDTHALGDFSDDEMAHLCRLYEDEWPMLIVKLTGKSIPVGGPGPRQAAPRPAAWAGGRPNLLSHEQVPYQLIENFHAATKLRNGDFHRVLAAESPPSASRGIHLPPPALSERGFGRIARNRRSALDFRGGAASISLAQLSALLAVTAQPLSADFGVSRFVRLYLYVHRVDGVEPGVYRYWPEHGQLERIRSGDQRVMAAGLSLQQELAGNSCVTFSMVADLERAVRWYGDRGYRYAHFEAGGIGQRLYIASEALGLGATGIGAFFDDDVNRYLNLAEGRQVIYHFAVGYPISDPRIVDR